MNTVLTSFNIWFAVKIHILPIDKLLNDLLERKQKITLTGLIETYFASLTFIMDIVSKWAVVYTLISNETISEHLFKQKTKQKTHTHKWPLELSIKCPKLTILHSKLDCLVSWQQYEHQDGMGWTKLYEQ